MNATNVLVFVIPVVVTHAYSIFQVVPLLDEKMLP